MTSVLVVDDEPQIVRALRINLTARGYDVMTAYDGKTALSVAVEGKPDVVVLDLGLPDIDGVDVIAGLRGWTSMPIIVLSARTDSARKVEALDAGADDYVTKPFGMDELLARLRAAVRRRTAAPAVGRPGGRDGDVHRRPGGEEGPPRRSRGAPDARPSGACSRSWRATPAGSCRRSSCCRRCGGRRTPGSPSTCGCTWRSCGASSSRNPRTRGT